MRGKANFRRRLRTCRGITPAYAGKRMIKPSVLDCIKDHPRLCGEKGLPCRVLCPAAGSPPPMRGKVQSSHVSSVRSRITPAYAGKSPFVVNTKISMWDHPRLCGEKELWCPYV